MTKLSIIAAAAALALFAFASSQPASAAMTPMPPASKPHPYTPDLRPNSQPTAKTYSPYTKLPSGPLLQNEQREQHQTRSK